MIIIYDKINVYVMGHKYKTSYNCHELVSEHHIFQAFCCKNKCGQFSTYSILCYVQYILWIYIHLPSWTVKGL